MFLVVQANRRSNAEAELIRVDAVWRACAKLADAGDPFFEERRPTLDALMLEFCSVPLEAMGTKRVISMARDATARTRSLESAFRAEQEERARRKVVQAQLELTEKGRLLARLRAADERMTDGELIVPDHDLRNSGPG